MSIANGKKDKILVVDDDRSVAELIKERLTLSGYEVETAYTGEESIQKIEKSLPDLILLDIMMPTMNGYQVFDTLRSKEGTKDIPIIFVTAKTDVKDWTHAMFKMGANSYITKPIDNKKLVEQVKSILEMKHSRDKLKKMQEKLSKSFEDPESQKP
jgi:two-component system response regulator VicR